jgi:hypothetical protein
MCARLEMEKIAHSLEPSSQKENGHDSKNQNSNL